MHGATPASWSVTGNVLLGTEEAIHNNATGTLPATQNWFGTNDVDEVDALVIGDVAFTPYWTNAGMTVASSVAQITSYVLTGNMGAGVTTLNEGTKRITVVMPAGTGVTSLLTPTIGIVGVEVSPISGLAREFTSPIWYTVTSYDREVGVAYKVTVTVAP